MLRPVLATALALLAAPAWSERAADPLQPSAAWDDLADDILGDVVPAMADGSLALEAPFRAADAAVVPIHITQGPGAPALESLVLVVDENPSPVAAEMTFGPLMMPLDLEVRVRVNQYSNVRAVGVTPTGEALMAGSYVRASGGCSAPAGGSPAEALAGLGDVRLREFGATDDGRLEAQIMVRHPQFSGFQRDQVTQLWVPAYFIERLEVYQGEDLLFTMVGGISVSENPVFRFRYADNGAADFRVRVVDTEGLIFQHILPKAAS